MTRRKSVCLKWTLVLLVVLVCPSVYTRPQEVPAITANSENEEKTTSTPIRYRHSNLSLNSFKLVPIVITFVNKTINRNNKKSVSHNVFNDSHNALDLSILLSTNATKEVEINNETALSRLGRFINFSSRGIQNKKRPKPVTNRNQDDYFSQNQKKPTIRTVITKWRDKTKFDDLIFSSEITSSPEQTHSEMNLNNYNNDTNIEGSEEINSKRYNRPPSDMYYNGHNKPGPQYSQESHMYSNNIQVVDSNSHPHIQVMEHYPRPTRPVYVHSIPTPTPIITNVGYPKPWTQNVRRTTTQKPRPNYEYHHNVNHHGGNYEVTTFEPTNSYTDRIVIRPEQYSPYPEDCPTIYLTLNNTFQGEGKEACPDLNIAVNTNVVNKNVVIESDEEGEGFFPGFGLGLDEDSILNGGDNSGTDSSKDEDYSESDENTEQNDSASIEGTELANYHSANSPIQSQSSEAGGFGAATSPISAITKPSSGGEDDDIFSFSSLIDFFRPALNAFSWLVTPLSLGLFPLLLAPLGLLFAGTGVAALFSPWFLPVGREAPKVIQVYKPEWRWDDKLKTWHLNSFPSNRRVVPETGRESTETKEINGILPLFRRLKQWIINFTNKIKENNQIQHNERRVKRRKRETWTRRLN
ncbi:unnamed protein product [Arctia plantaginis]|uniref:Uncharacterized protein n=1 Tax=Arctia plantaginis TaxID=874455 RepID=A0A8S1A4T2_ARCPL|nr:unnamed protein product [Arctia plantaginis]